jgi:hypothetical protein
MISDCRFMICGRKLTEAFLLSGDSFSFRIGAGRQPP